MRGLLLTAALLSLAALPAKAELRTGDRAPEFTARAALAGSQTGFNLAEALAKGPVVLYFFPEALTGNCLLENYEFSYALGDFQRLGATVAGMSHDSIEVLQLASLLECSDKLPLLADPGLAVIRAYDAENAARPGYALSAAFIIAPGGEIVYSHVNADSDPVRHVEGVVRALEAWAAGNKI